MSYREINEHFKTGCPSVRNFTCPLKCKGSEECFISGIQDKYYFKEELSSHLKNDCPNMTVECPGCGETSKQSEKIKHKTAICLMNLRAQRVKQEA